MRFPSPRRIASLVAMTLLSLGLLAIQASAQSCTDEVGAEEAQIYADQCIEVSPATRPPCNVQNSCNLIVDEIIRGCDMLGEDAPSFCADYSD